MSSLELVILNLDYWKQWKKWIKESVLDFYFRPEANITNIIMTIEGIVRYFKLHNIQVESYLTEEESNWVDFLDGYTSEEIELTAKISVAKNKEEIKRLNKISNKRKKPIIENIKEVQELHFKLAKLGGMLLCFSNIEIGKKILEDELKELDKAYKIFMQKKEIGENFDKAKSMFDKVLKKMDMKIEEIAKLIYKNE